MTNRFGVANAATQALVVAALKDGGFDARPTRRHPGPGVGVAGKLTAEQEERAWAIAKRTDPTATKWPPGSFAR